jgi:hypothetical protein
VESYPPITLFLVRLETNDVFIINTEQNITFLRNTCLLIIVWELWPLNNVNIHYLIWGLKTWGVTSPPPYFGTVLSAYTKQESKFQKLFKHLWVLVPHGIFMLSGSIFKTVVGPLKFYQLYNSIMKHFGFFVQYSH